MYTVSPSSKESQTILRKFSIEIFTYMESTNEWDNINEIQNIFTGAVNDTLNSNLKRNNKFKKPRIPIPFYGFVLEDRCFGVKKNHNLYTQCMNAKSDGRYCKVCGKQAKNSSSGKPVYGDIMDRKASWNEQLIWAPEGKTKEVPYMNIVNKLGINISQAESIVNDFGWCAIPNCHREARKVRRGRPKVKNVAVDDSDDENKPKRKRGRPVGSFKPKEKEKEPTDEELIALLCGE